LSFAFVPDPSALRRQIVQPAPGAVVELVAKNTSELTPSSVTAIAVTCAVEPTISACDPGKRLRLRI
jgi:hypothetical protein